MEHIVVGVDPRQTQFAVLARAADLAGRLGAELDVVHVQRLTHGEIRAMVSTVPGPQLAERFLEEDERAEAAAARLVTARALAGTDVRWQVQIRAGDPADNLLAVADEMNAYLIVIGTHLGGRPFLDRLLAGSVSHRLLHRTHRPVLVVPASEADEHPSTADTAGRRSAPGNGTNAG